MDRYEIYHFYARASCFNTKSKGLQNQFLILSFIFQSFFYIRMNLFWNCFLPIKSHGSRYNIYLKAKCRLFLNNSFTPERMIYEVVLTFESADEIRWCDHLNETSLAVLLRCTICFSEFYRMKFGISVHFILWPFLWVKELKQPL